MNLLSALIPKSEVATLDGNDTLRMAVEKMNHHRYAMIPVIGSQGHYLYSISTGDILFYLAEHDMTLREMEEVPLGSVPVYRPLMALPVTSGNEEVIEALMNQNYVPLVDERGIFVGILTRKKLFEALSKKDA
ncbi:MAG: CBS domain-containing protein [Bacilli bacterium]|nr:CBS domain-containing protein [Bacilli bacterium]